MVATVSLEVGAGVATVFTLGATAAVDLYAGFNSSSSNSSDGGSPAGLGKTDAE